MAGRIARRQVSKIVTVVVLLALIVLYIGVFRSLKSRVAPAFESTITVELGLGREARTRQALVDVCAVRPESEPVVCAERDAPIPRSTSAPTTSTEGAAPTTADRPAILSTTLMGDFDTPACRSLALAQARVRGEAPPDVSKFAGSGQFPAGQIDVSSELVGRTGIRFTIVANPRAPERVAAGMYCGRIVVERESGKFISKDVLIVMTNRNGLPILAAMLSLLLGAMIGIAVRLANDPFAALVPLHRRRRSLERWLVTSGLSDSERTAFENGLANVQDAIASLGVDDAKKELDRLEGIVAEISATDADARPAVATRLLANDDQPPVTALPGTTTVVWILERFWWLSVVLIVIVVVTVGLQTQYLDPAGLDSSFETWFSLTVFAFAFQLSATTLAEAAGRLAPFAQR